jgi:hypothetical protein
MLHITGSQYHVPDNDVFYSHGQLHSGIICKRTVIEQKIGKFISGTQEFYQVVESTIENINAGDVVIVKERTSSPFIAHNQSLSFIAGHNVLLVASKDLGVIAGPMHLILTPEHEGYDNENIEKIKSANGYYFDHYDLRLTIKGKLMLVVAKKDIQAQYTIEDNSRRTTLLK